MKGLSHAEAMQHGEQTRESVLAFIRDSTKSRGFPPSVREIGEHVGLSSTSTVHAHLVRLQRDGRIEIHPGLPRTIRVVA